MVAEKFPGRITIAEDRQNNEWLTKDVGAGGAGFGSQWDAKFVHPIRQAVITAEDEQRSLSAIRDALCYRYDDAFDRVIYSESHDEMASGKARVPQEGCIIGFPAAGTWKLRFNSNWQGCSKDFEGHWSGDPVSKPGECDGFPIRGALYIGPYSVLIFSQ
jgi:hypothetical protein